MTDSQQAVSVPVLQYYKYLGPDSQTVYNTQYFCGSCRRKIESPYTFPKYPEDLEAENEQQWPRLERSKGELEHYSFCPWCGVEFEDEWWKDRMIQNERAIDHYQNPGTHKGDTHEFRGDGPDCMANHWLGVSGGDKVCWCDPEIEPGIMGCVIRHRDVSYEEYLAQQAEMDEEEERDDDEEQFETAEEFETWYANNSGVTVEFLHAHGRRGAPCDCGEEGCTGWQMLHEAYE